jgi:hypothetical protein
MCADLSTRLRIEKSMNFSGQLLNQKSIEAIKNKHYYVESFPLDGDAPKQFIKLYTYEEDSGIRRQDVRSWVPYIAKTAEKWYPHESVIEYMINRVGQTLGLVMNDVKLLIINEQIRFLSKYFLTKNESLIHGAEICGEFLEDMELAKQIADEKKTARELFTFEFISKALQVIFSRNHEKIINDLVRMLAFDALVGNNDRHFYNWGIIATKKKSNQLPKFAPVYDSARGLLWNISDEKILHWLQMQKSSGKHIARYIDDACPRISVEGNKEVDHFGLMAFLKDRNKGFKETINELSSLENEDNVQNMLKREFFPFFIKERCELTSYIIQERFKKVREI